MLVLNLWLIQEKVHEVFTLEPKHQFLFVGDSHVGCSITEDEKFNNRVIWRSINSPVCTLIRLREIESNGTLKHVKVFVTEVGYQTFTGETTRECFEPTVYNLLPLYWTKLLKYLADYPELRHPVFKNIMRWKKFHFEEVRPSTTLPFIHRDPNTRKRFAPRAIDEKVLQDVSIPQNGIARYNYDALLEVNKICKRNNVIFVLFSAPILSEYRDSVPQTVIAPFEHIVNVLQKEHNIRYYNFMSAMPDLAFQDWDHLLITSAPVFTEMFVKELQRLSNDRRE